METTWWPTVVALLYDLTGIPISYFHDSYTTELSEGSRVILVIAILAPLITVIVLTTRKHIKSYMYFGFAMLSFSSIIDLLLALEGDGIIQGFMGLYLKKGEPYLHSAWGSVVSYWDGVVFFACYVVMAFKSSNGMSYRTLGLHYSSAILNSMLVLLLGACLSQSGITGLTALNIPYVVFPMVVAIKCLTEKPKNRPVSMQPGWVDTLLAVLLLEAAVVALIKGLASLRGEQSIVAWYRELAEPIINQNEPAPFAALQGLVSLFYFLPAYIVVAGGLVMNPGQPWLHDLTILLAGATSHAGITIVGMSYHRLTNPEHEAPKLTNHSAFIAFWAANLLTSLVPQLVAIRLCYIKSDDEGKVIKPAKSTNIIKQVKSVSSIKPGKSAKLSPDNTSKKDRTISNGKTKTKKNKLKEN
uniref:EXPERA domain-containing protein n=1 Tax=Timema douglasi TaxID=61478 RepID=A0A7R8ZCM5_TIMDO|nr:unnamed protein product [Timema douglasi]